MKNRTAWLLMVSGFICGMWLLAGCSMRTKHEWLTLFFDGVPPLSTDTNAVGVTRQAGPGERGQGTNRPPARAVVKRAPIIFHPPYSDNACDACHESKYSQKLKGKAQDVCFACHDNFLEKAKVKHSPAEEGECMACHDPHQSPEKFLLKQKGKALCYQCHDDMATAKVKHSPVEDGECLACHDPHQSAEEYLLKKQGQAVCYDCHDQADITEQPAHRMMADAACTSCHDPHSSDNEKLLKTAASKPAPPPP